MANTSVTVYLDADLLARVRAAAESEGRSVSNLLAYHLGKIYQHRSTDELVAWGLQFAEKNPQVDLEEVTGPPRRKPTRHK